MKDKLQPLGLLLLRVPVGLLLALHHGLPKLLGFSQKAAHFPDPLHVGHATSLALAVFGELVCGLAVALGLFTRFAAMPAAFTMLVAVGIVHAGAPLEEGELALVYLVAFVTVGLLGPGAWSLDAIVARRRK